MGLGQPIGGAAIGCAGAGAPKPRPQVETGGIRGLDQGRGPGRGHREGVETRARLGLQPKGSQAQGQGLAQDQQPAGHRRQPLGAVVHRVEAGDHRQEHLGGADVAGRLIAADVLLARLQGQA